MAYFKCEVCNKKKRFSLRKFIRSFFAVVVVLLSYMLKGSYLPARQRSQTHVKCCEVFLGRSQRLELNTIENLSSVKRQLKIRKCKSDDELFVCLREKWDNLSLQYFQKPEANFPKRCPKGLNTEGIKSVIKHWVLIFAVQCHVKSFQMNKNCVSFWPL